MHANMHNYKKTVDENMAQNAKISRESQASSSNVQFLYMAKNDITSFLHSKC